jgi:ribosomal-protein-alanine N-acetyltransferase
MSEQFAELKPVPYHVISGGGVATALKSSTRPKAVEVLAPNILRTPRLVLRPLRANDREQFLHMIDVSRVQLERWVRPHREGESDLALFERQLMMCEEGDRRGLAFRRVAMLDDGRLAGCFNLNSISRGIICEADFTWWMSSELTGAGLATEAAEAMMEFALLAHPSGLGLHRVQAAIHPSNARSVKMASKLGLKKQEGATVSILMGEQWEAHDLYSRTVTG